MTLQYQGGPVVGSMMTVWDLDKQAFRKINLATIQGCGLVLKEAKRTFEEVRQELHDLLF